MITNTGSSSKSIPSLLQYPCGACTWLIGADFLACVALRSKYRWVLTATPIANTAKGWSPFVVLAFAVHTDKL